MCTTDTYSAADKVPGTKGTKVTPGSCVMKLRASHTITGLGQIALLSVLAAEILRRRGEMKNLLGKKWS